MVLIELIKLRLPREEGTKMVRIYKHVNPRDYCSAPKSIPFASADADADAD